MAYSKLNIIAPDVNRTFNGNGINYAAPSVIKANTDMLSSVLAQYGSIINVWGKEFALPNYVVAAFICTESAGNNVPKNAFGATGLMQMTAETVYEIITKWDNKVDVPLSPATMAVLSKYVPNWKKDWDANKPFSSSQQRKVESALTNVDFNIALGCANIRWLLEAFSMFGEGRLNKTMVAYNKGYYAAKDKLSGNLTTPQILAIKGLGVEPKGYLLKMLGVNGFLDLWFKNIKNTGQTA